MPDLNLPANVKKDLDNFSKGLKDVYGPDLVSLIVYGSVASGEFIDKRSNINLLVLLKDAGLPNLKKSAKIIRKSGLIKAIFLTPDYIKASSDVFPVEFLDMRENYTLVFGEDLLKELNIDLRNLRFQCEQEIKSKIITLKQAYLGLSQSKSALEELLFKSFNSSLHILRNVLRLKGKVPPYNKQEIINALAQDYGISLSLWQEILSAKNKRIKLTSGKLEDLFFSFVKDLERAAEIVDKA